MPAAGVQGNRWWVCCRNCGQNVISIADTEEGVWAGAWRRPSGTSRVAESSVPAVGHGPRQFLVSMPPCGGRIGYSRLFNRWPESRSRGVRWFGHHHDNARLPIHRLFPPTAAVGIGRAAGKIVPKKPMIIPPEPQMLKLGIGEAEWSQHPTRTNTLPGQIQGPQGLCSPPSSCSRSTRPSELANSGYQRCLHLLWNDQLLSRNVTVFCITLYLAHFPPIRSSAPQPDFIGVKERQPRSTDFSLRQSPYGFVPTEKHDTGKIAPEASREPLGPYAGREDHIHIQVCRFGAVELRAFLSLSRHQSQICYP